MKISKYTTHVLPGNYISIIVDTIGQLGHDLNPVLRYFNIDKQQLNDPRLWLNLLQVNAIIKAGMEATKNPALGLYIGEKLNMTTHGYVGYAAMCCDNLQQSVELAIKYFRNRVGLAAMRFYVEGDQAVLEFSSLFVLGEIKRIIIDAILASFHQMRMFLLGNNYGPTEVRVKHDASAYINDFKRVFDSEVKYNADANQYRFPAKELEMTLSLADPAAKQAALEQCEILLSTIENRSDIVSRIRLMLMEQPGQFPEADEVANKLNISTRTLRRKLQTNEVTFQEILDNVKQELAVNYLKETALSIDEISDLMGYSNSANFCHAFKRWTGRTPKSYR